MKCKISAAAFKNLVKSLQALHSLGLNRKDEEICCVLTVKNDRLYIEGANMGAYLRRNAQVTVLREGSCGVRLGGLSKLKLKSDIMLEYDPDKCQVRVLSGRSRFNLQADVTASSVVEASRPQGNQITFQASIPSAILRDATSTVAIKPGLKEESLTLLFSMDQTPDGGRLEVVGTEHYSMARYWRVSDDIKVQEPMRFALPSSSCGVLMKEVTSSHVRVGVSTRQNQDGGAVVSLVRFGSPDTDVYYPTVDVEFHDAEENNREIRQGRFDGSFLATKGDLRDAVNIVKVLHDSATTSPIYLRIAKDRVELLTKSASGASGNTIIPSSDVRLPEGNKPQVLHLKEQYLSEAIELSPDGLPLKVESWNKRLLFVEATQVENGGVEMLISQVLTPEAQES